MKTLYTPSDIALMQAAEEVNMLSVNCIEAIRQFAQAAGVSRIGIANCIVFSRQTKRLIDYFSAEFEVFSVDCKYGRLTKGELFKTRNPRVVCNPAGQADFLNQKKTELNISMGLCVGHDLVFSQKSHAPVTTLFVKDFVTGHDANQAIAQLGAKPHN